MRYARIADGLVAEIIDLPDDVELKDAFHPDIVATIVECADESVTSGHGYDGKKFAPPVPPPAPEVIRQATGRQLRYALNEIGNRAAWDTALGKAKPNDVDYWITLGSGDLAPEDNPKLARIAKAAKIKLDDLFAEALAT